MYTQKAMKGKIFIFDFDGTIADTLDHNAKIYNRLAEEFNFRKITSADYDELKDKTSKELIRHLEVPLLKIPLLLKRARTDLHKNIDSVMPIQGFKETLSRLKSDGNTIGILSSNSSKNVKRFLQNHSMDFFDFIMTPLRIWSKSIHLKNFIRQRKLLRQNIFYIGDEVRDIETAKRTEVKSVAVTWGYNSKKALESHHPDFLINSPEKLIELF